MKLTERVREVLGERADWTAGELADRLGDPHASRDIGSALAKLARTGAVLKVLPVQRRLSPITGAPNEVWRRPVGSQAETARVARKLPLEVRKLRAELDRVERSCPAPGCGWESPARTRRGVWRHLEEAHGAAL